MVVQICQKPLLENAFSHEYKCIYRTYYIKKKFLYDAVKHRRVFILHFNSRKPLELKMSFWKVLCTICRRKLEIQWKMKMYNGVLEH